ncbi:MAG: nucleotidyltransferase family protein [Pseudomonadota bacterium]
MMLTREFRLAAACCRRPGPERDSAVRDAARAIDWVAFAAVLRRQRIDGFAHRALADAAVTVPDAIAAALAQGAARTATGNLRAAAETARLGRVFADAGMPCLFVKGSTLAQLAWGTLATKYSKDIDLLVRPQDVDRGLALLEADGYLLWLPAHHLTPAQRRIAIRHINEFVLVHPTRRLQVELHWRLARNAALLPGLGATSAVQQVALGGGACAATLTTPDLASYLAVHGAVHCWSRLKWLADFDALVGEQDVAALYDHAVALGAGRAFGQGLTLSRMLLGRTLPTEVAARIAADRAIPAMTATALDLLAGGGATELDERPGAALRVTLAGLRLAPGWRFRAQALRQLLFTSYDAYRTPLPRALHGLYPVLRGPLWLIRLIRHRGRPPGEPPLPVARPLS